MPGLSSIDRVAWRARLGGWAAEPRRVLPVTLPLLALVLTGMLLYTHGYHIDLEVYRFGVRRGSPAATCTARCRPP